MQKCVRLRLLRAECFGPWDLSRTRPEWELSQVLKFLASPKILALEDQEGEARTLDFWEPTDSEDSDQHDKDDHSHRQRCRGGRMTSPRQRTRHHLHAGKNVAEHQIVRDKGRRGRVWQGQIAQRARSSEESIGRIHGRQL